MAMGEGTARLEQGAAMFEQLARVARQPLAQGSRSVRPASSRQRAIVWERMSRLADLELVGEELLV
jgi:hypothetical protein